MTEMDAIRDAYRRISQLTGEAIEQGSHIVTLNAEDVAMVIANLRFKLDDEPEPAEAEQPTSRYFAD